MAKPFLSTKHVHGLCIPEAFPSHQVLSRLAAVLQISISTSSALRRDLHHIAELAVA